MTLESVRYTENTISASVTDIPNMCMKVSIIENEKGGFTGLHCVTGVGKISVMLIATS